MKQILGVVVVLSVLLAAGPASAEKINDSYQANLQRTFVRGLKNIVTAPVEIPYRIGEHHRKDTAPPVFREAAGFLDGIFGTLERLASGVWDIGMSFVPGFQEGIPVEPETFI